MSENNDRPSAALSHFLPAEHFDTSYKSHDSSLLDDRMRDSHFETRKMADCRREGKHTFNVRMFSIDRYRNNRPNRNNQPYFLSELMFLSLVGC